MPVRASPSPSSCPCLCHLAAFVQSVKKNSGCSLSACTPPLVSKLLLTSARSLAQRVTVSM